MPFSKHVSSRLAPPLIHRAVARVSFILACLCPPLGALLAPLASIPVLHGVVASLPLAVGFLLLGGFASFINVRAWKTSRLVYAQTLSNARSVYADAASALRSDQPEHSRIASVSALENLAAQYPDELPPVADILCSFLRTRLVSQPPRNPNDPDAPDDPFAEPNPAPPDAESALRSLSRLSLLHGAFLRDEDLRFNLSNVAWSGFIIADYLHLPYVDLSYADLRGAVMLQACLQDAILLGADLSNAVLTRADLRGADLSDAILNNANARLANLSGAVLRRAQASRVVFAEASLLGASADDAVFQHTDFQSADLSHARLWGADCSHADFHDAVLRAAWIENTQFADARLAPDALARCLWNENPPASLPADVIAPPRASPDDWDAALSP